MMKPDDESKPPRSEAKSADHNPTEDMPWTYELEPENQSEPQSPAESTDRVESTRPASASDTDSTGHVAAQKPASSPVDMKTPFVGGFGKFRVTLWALGATLLLGLLVAGVRAGDGTIMTLAAALARVLLTVAVNGIIGTLAVIAAARCVGTRVAEPELFAARMLVASAVFSLLYETGTPIPTRIDDWLLGAAGFAVVVWFLFRLTLRQTALVLAWHVGMLIVIWLSSWLATAAPREQEPQMQMHEEVLPGDQFPAGVG